MKNRILLFVLLSVLSIVSYAQSQLPTATGVPYECSFETNEDLSAWVLNEGSATAVDQWMIGSGAHSEGQRSMYISSNHSDPVYGHNPNVVVSYLRYKFPSKGHYNLCFDWKGVGDSATSKLYVLFCPEVAFRDSNVAEYIGNIVKPSTNRAELTPNVVAVCDTLNDSAHPYLCGNQYWKTVSTELSVKGVWSTQSFVIVFIWVNNNTDGMVLNSSIAIDNLQITTATIPNPKNVQAIPQCEDSTMLVTWESSATHFDIEYRKVGDAGWRQYREISDGEYGFCRNGSQCSFLLPRILEGTYDVRVRGMAISNDQLDTLHTGWVYRTNILVYCPDNHCVNYINFKDTSKVLCTWGTYTNPYEHVGFKDFGPDWIESRHTLHVDPDELDPASNYKLHTVPPGALASVRLGNWKDGAEGESITYDIAVDSFYQGILIVRYAVVLEEPGHDEGPEFRLEVLDENGDLIDPTCGQAHFTYSDAVDAGWNVVSVPNPNPTESQSLTTVAWKDWTTVGVNLTQYHGQNIKVRFTTMDCNWSGHFGYAYFTLDCANAHIETNNCGNDARVTCSAPDGFNYQWFNEQGQLVSTDRELNVDASGHYACRVSYIDEPSCYFEMHTFIMPRFPVPAFEVQHAPHDCVNFLKFINRSHVMTKYEGWENHTAEECNDVYEWRFRRLSDGLTTMSTAKNPIYSCRQQGDSIQVTLTAYLGVDNVCDSTILETIYVPSIIHDTLVFYRTIREGEFLQFDGQFFDSDTVYIAHNPSYAGCDSVTILYLTVLPDEQAVIDIYDPKGNGTRKVFYRDQLYIILNDEWYNAEGKHIGDPRE